MADLALRISITARQKAVKGIKPVRLELEKIQRVSEGASRSAARLMERQTKAVKDSTRAQWGLADVEKKRHRAARKGVRAITLEEAKRNEQIREQNRLIKAQARKELGIKGRAGVDPDAAATNLSIAGSTLQRGGDAATRFFLGARDEALTFSKAVAEVTTISSTSRDEIEGMAKDLAKEYGGLPAGQAEAFYSIVSSGWEETGQAADIWRESNKLAVAGVTDTQSAFLAQNAIMKPYADSVKEASTANELLFQTIKDGQTTLPELSAALPRVTSVAAEAGVSIEEVLASISALTGQGLAKNTDDAATQIAGAYAKVIKPSEQARKEFQKLRKGSEALKDFKDIGEAVDALGFKGFLEVASSSSKFDKNSFGKLFEDVQGLRAVLSLQGGADDAFGKNLNNLSDDTLVFGDALKKQMNDPSKKAEKQMAKLKVQMIELGEKAIPVIEKAADAVLPVLEKVIDFADKHPELVKLALGAAVGSAVLGRGLQGASALAGLSGGRAFQQAAGGPGGGPGVGPGQAMSKLGSQTMILVATFMAAYNTMKMIDENYLHLSDWIAGVGKEDNLDRQLHGGRTEQRGGVGFLQEGEAGYATQGQRATQLKILESLRGELDEAKKARKKAQFGTAALAATGVGGLIFGAKAKAEKDRIATLESEIAKEEAALAKLDGRIDVKITDERTLAQVTQQPGGGVDLSVDGDTP